MKVLFIGEGRHDIGDPSPDQPRIARGTGPALTRRVNSKVAADSVALAWAEIRRFNPSAQKSGYLAKIAAAVLVAVKRLGCAATVVVADRDGQDIRQAQLDQGVERARQVFPNHPAVWGLAFDAIEAWTLGVPDNIAQELGLDPAPVRELYPQGVKIEHLSERSGKLDHRPKKLLERIIQLKHITDSAEFREAVAARTDVAVLAKACPQGFAPFADRVRRELGSDS